MLTSKFRYLFFVFIFLIIIFLFVIYYIDPINYDDWHLGLNNTYLENTLNLNVYTIKYNY